jgi:hypothetical protein
MVSRILARWNCSGPSSLFLKLCKFVVISFGSGRERHVSGEEAGGGIARGGVGFKVQKIL